MSGFPKHYKTHQLPQVCLKSGALFKAMLRKRGLGVRDLKRLICQTTPVSLFLVESWMGNKRATTISPIYFPLLTTVLDLTDEEIEALMLLTLQEWGPYWTDNGRDTPQGKQHTYAEIAEGWGCSRQNIERLENRILLQIAPLFK